jgi:hypothetical protein
MYSILVLGLIPGTNIQISFQVWLLILDGLLVYITFVRPRRQHRPLAVIVAIRQAVQTSLLHLWVR